MRREAEQITLMPNFILFSNENAVPITKDDRRFNVAPKQKITFHRKEPNADAIIDDHLPAEIDDLARLLWQTKVDQKDLHIPVKNKAREQLIAATKVTSDVFVTSLIDGDIDALIEPYLTEKGLSRTVLNQHAFDAEVLLLEMDLAQWCETAIWNARHPRAQWKPAKVTDSALAKLYQLCYARGKRSSYGLTKLFSESPRAAALPAKVSMRAPSKDCPQRGRMIFMVSKQPKELLDVAAAILDEKTIDTMLTTIRTTEKRTHEKTTGNVGF
jgi:hypothetical protein